MASEPVSIFFSYSRKDEALMRELESHLEPLRLSRLIESWHDGCITPGEEWAPQIKENLQKAQIILLLISVNFISSEYCNTVELTQAIKRHKSGDALVIPLILKPCMWHRIPMGDMTLGELQALPKDARPVTLWDNLDEAYTNIAEALYEKVRQVQQDLQAANLKRQVDRYYTSGMNDLEQGNYSRAITHFTHAEHLGCPKSALMIVQAQEKWLLVEDDLSSEKGIDYRYLRDLLKAQNWRAADLETGEIMVQATGKQHESSPSKGLTTQPQIDSSNFPCTDLLTIDQLWIKYSRRRFGFSVQKEIFTRECGAILAGSYPDEQVWDKFADLVGWRANEKWLYRGNLNYNLSAQRGHLPSITGGWDGKSSWRLIYGRVGLLGRIETCELEFQL